MIYCNIPSDPGQITISRWQWISKIFTSRVDPRSKHFQKEKAFLVRRSWAADRLTIEMRDSKHKRKNSHASWRTLFLAETAWERINACGVWEVTPSATLIEKCRLWTLWTPWHNYSTLLGVCSNCLASVLIAISWLFGMGKPFFFIHPSCHQQQPSRGLICACVYRCTDLCRNYTQDERAIFSYNVVGSFFSPRIKKVSAQRKSLLPVQLGHSHG